MTGEPMSVVYLAILALLAVIWALKKEKGD